MAWVTPAAFVANETLTAAKLNQLVDAVAFLNGLSAGPIPPFPVLKSADNAANTGQYYVRHRSNYLHVVTWHNGANRLYITLNGVLVSSATPAAGYVDTVLNISAYGFTPGAFVSVDIEIRANSGCNMSLLYVTELESATALV